MKFTINFYSIKTKNIIFIIITFTTYSLLVMFTFDIFSRSLIDKTQKELYTEKLQAIHNSLRSRYQKLEATLSIETYEESFQDIFLNEFRKTYYTRKNQNIYPIVIDHKGIVMAHPVLSKGNRSLRNRNFIKNIINKKNGTLNYDFQNESKWVIYREFSSWKWFIAFTVPHDIKYSIIYKQRRIIIIIVLLLTIIITLVVTYFSSTFTSTIQKLTNFASKISSGKAKQEINIVRSDELGTLATSLDKMHIAILEKMELEKFAKQSLEQNNEELERRVQKRTTELQNLNKLYKHAKEAADAASIAKSEFLANMSHEIRTPMNGVIAAVDLALGEEISDKAREFLQMIQSSGYTLMGIINDILDFSKIEAGKLELEKHTIHINNIINKIEISFKNSLNKKEINFIIDLKPDCPTKFLGDELRIIQILNNLLSNAIKFSNEKGKIILSISSCSSSNTLKDHTELTFFVKDNGLGMTKEQSLKIFKPFTQADSSTTRNYGGTGLGLSITQKLVNLMNGKMWVETEQDKGTTFYFTVQLENVSDEKEENYIIPTELKNLNCLVIENQSEFQKITSDILKSFNFKVKATSLAKEGLNLLKENKFDVIFIDWDLPDLTANTTAKIIKNEIKIKIPILLMATDLQIKKIKYDHEIFDGLLKKPFYASPVYNSIINLFKLELENIKTKPDKNIDLNFYKTVLENKKILVAEDNITNQQIINAILLKNDAIVTLVNNGLEAIEILEKEIFDIVLMDIQMPVMDGFEATKQIKKKKNLKKIPIVALTAHAMTSDREKCFEAGMINYITKPINQKHLLKILYDILK